jgi:hypothetical protein
MEYSTTCATAAEVVGHPVHIYDNVHFDCPCQFFSYCKACVEKDDEGYAEKDCVINTADASVLKSDVLDGDAKMKAGIRLSG